MILRYSCSGFHSPSSGEGNAQIEGAITAEVVLLFRWRERELNYIVGKMCDICIGVVGRQGRRGRSVSLTQFLYAGFQVQLELVA